jgi:hypothetical protein
LICWSVWLFCNSLLKGGDLVNPFNRFFRRDAPASSDIQTPADAQQQARQFSPGRPELPTLKQVMAAAQAAEQQPEPVQS